MLKIENVSKTYKKGNKKALNNVSLNIKKGEFVALLGQNGAGKSTLINVLAGNVVKDEGKVVLDGFDLDKNELDTKRILGVVPQEISFDSFFSVGETLKNQAGYFGLKNYDNYLDELLNKLSLTDKKTANTRALSGGMKRRLLIAKALIHKPKLVILDEPTAGVDIELRHSLYEFLEELHKNGTTIILTTHYLEEAEKLCDRIIVINDGEIIADDSKENLMTSFSKESLLELHFDYKLNIDDFEFLSNYSPEIYQENKLLLKIDKSDLANVFQQITKKNIHYNNFMLQHQKLEDVYLKLVKKKGE